MQTVPDYGILCVYTSLHRPAECAPISVLLATRPLFFRHGASEYPGLFTVSSEATTSIMANKSSKSEPSQTFSSQMSWLKSAAFRAVKDRLKTKVISLAEMAAGERCGI